MKNVIGASIRQTRYIELDSLRGLAALIVVLHHLRGLWETDTQPTSVICRFLLDLVTPFGFDAVLMFFVLSGFVLSLPAVNGRPQTYSTFLIRRVFRIYVPYLAVLLASVAGAFWLHGIVTRSIWFHQFWSEPVDWRLVGQHVLFLGVYNPNQFDPPIWSLMYEMRISLIFPLLCGLVLRLKSKWSLAIGAGLSVSAILIVKRPFYIGLTTGDTLHYAGLFVLGIFLARERRRLGEWFRRRRQIVKVLIGAAFLWLFLFAGHPVTVASDHFLHHFLFCVSQWITAFGAAGVMIICMNSATCKRALSWPPIHFLGEVSYSLYLWHFVVILYCVHLLYGKIPLWVILCLSLVLSVAVSWFSYRWIEVPSMNLGRKLSNTFRRASPSSSP
jgi:peptidoglycan/LPS O-acetylase OafA/YrhL